MLGSDFNGVFEPRRLFCNKADIAYADTFLSAFAKLRQATISFVMSVRPHETAQLSLDGFRWKLIFDYFSEVCRVNSIWREDFMYIYDSISLSSSYNEKCFRHKV